MSKPARGAARKTAPARQPAAKPPERRGVPRTGRIVTMVLGQGHGFIRLPSHRNVFFHRSDVRGQTPSRPFSRSISRGKRHSSSDSVLTIRSPSLHASLNGDGDLM